MGDRKSPIDYLARAKTMTPEEVARVLRENASLKHRLNEANMQLGGRRVMDDILEKADKDR